MILSSPINRTDRAARPRQPEAEDAVLLGGVEVIVVVKAIYNGFDHKNLNNGKEIEPGTRIILDEAYADRLITAGLVRVPTEEEIAPAAAPQTYTAAEAVALLSNIVQAADQAAEQFQADQEEWLDYTPLLAAEIPDSVAIALFDRGFVSKVRFQESYAQDGLNGLLAINGIGQTRATKIMRWAGVTVE